LEKPKEVFEFSPTEELDYSENKYYEFYIQAPNGEAILYKNVLAEAFEILAAEDEILAPKDASKQKEFNDLIESLPSGSRVDTVQALKSKGIELARAADLRNQGAATDSKIGVLANVILFEIPNKNIGPKGASYELFENAQTTRNATTLFERIEEFEEEG